MGFATREGLLPALLVLLLPLGILAVLVKLLPPWTVPEATQLDRHREASEPAIIH